MLPYVWTRSLTGRREGTKRVVCTYRQESSDPRLSGTVDIVINVDERQGDRSASMWGTSRLRNQGGTWVGRWTGGIAGRAAWRRRAQPAYGTAKGTGDYAGLVARGGWMLWEAGAGFAPRTESSARGGSRRPTGARCRRPPDPARRRRTARRSSASPP